jgi:hypothetical protein
LTLSKRRHHGGNKVTLNGPYLTSRPAAKSRRGGFCLLAIGLSGVDGIDPKAVNAVAHSMGMKAFAAQAVDSHGTFSYCYKK